MAKVGVRFLDTPCRTGEGTPIRRSQPWGITVTTPAASIANHDKPWLLVVEGDIELQTQLRWHFNNYNVVVAEDPGSAVAAFESHNPSVVLMTLDQHEEDSAVDVNQGVRLMQDLLERDQHAKIIVTTETSGYEHAIRAVGLGAYDYFQKPLNMTSVDLIIQRAFQMHELEMHNMQLRGKDETPLEGLVTSDPAMLKVCRKIEKKSRQPTCHAFSRARAAPAKK